MSDPTSTISRSFRSDPDRDDHLIKTSEALTVGALASVLNSAGTVEFADDADGLIPVGVVLGQAFGDNESLTGDATVKAAVRSGIVLENVSVTGVTSGADIGKFVYATDGQTMTLTQPATGLPLGVVVKWNATTYVDIYLFGLKECRFVKSPLKRKSLGVYALNAFQGTTAMTLYTETAYEHYEIVSLHALPQGYDAGVVAGAQTFNCAIGGTDTTGGVLTLGFGSFNETGDMGTVIDATAITAANEVHMGDTVILEMAASGTGFTADQAVNVEIFAIVRELPGA